MSREEATDPHADAQNPRRWWRSPKTWIITGVAVLTVVAIGVGSFFLFSPKRSMTAGRTVTVQATQGTQTASVSLEGTLSPTKQANLNFPVSGEVTKVYVKSGQKVTKGQKLAKINPASLQDAVDLAEANLTSAEANYSDVSSSGTSAAIKAAAAQVDSAKAALSSAKQDRTSATLRATMKGTIASVDLAVGDQVTGSGSTTASRSSSSTGSSSSATSTSSSGSSAQIVLIATSTWKLEGTVGASDLSSLKPGQAAAITADSASLSGKVSSVGIVATSTSDGAATFPVVITVTGTHSDLYSGTTASAVITTGSYDNVLSVPTAAITSQGGKTVVTKVGSNGATSVVTVEIGRVFGDATQITSGLSADDSVQISYRPSSASSASNSDSGGGLGGGLGGIGGGGAPPAGGMGGGPGR